MNTFIRFRLSVFLPVFSLLTCVFISGCSSRHTAWPESTPTDSAPANSAESELTNFNESETASENPNFTVVSGSHQIEALVCVPPLNFAELADSVSWLEIDRLADFVPFRVYREGSEFSAGRYSLYDADTNEEIAFPLDEDVETQAYLLEYAQPEHSYIVTVTTTDDDYQPIKLCFGIHTSPDPTENEIRFSPFTLEEVPDDYNRESALADGLIISESAFATSGDEQWKDFVETVNAGIPARILLGSYYTLDDTLNYDEAYYESIKDHYPHFEIMELTFDGKIYRCRSIIDDTLSVCRYRYLIRYEIDSDTSKPYECYMLTKISGLTWEEIENDRIPNAIFPKLDVWGIYLRYITETEN